MKKKPTRSKIRKRSRIPKRSRSEKRKERKSVKHTKSIRKTINTTNTTKRNQRKRRSEMIDKVRRRNIEIEKRERNIYDTLAPIADTKFFFTHPFCSFSPANSSSFQFSLYPPHGKTTPLFGVFMNGNYVTDMLRMTKERVDVAIQQQFDAYYTGKIPGMPEPNREQMLHRFLDLFLVREADGSITVNAANTLSDPDVLESDYSMFGSKLNGTEPFRNDDLNPGAINTTINFVAYILANASADYLLDNIIHKSKILKVTLDYYQGRPAGMIGLHKDTSYTSNTAMATLSFENTKPEFGPELISLQMDQSKWKSHREDQFFPTREMAEGNKDLLVAYPEKYVFRPVVPGNKASGGTVFFNDKLMSHSSPGNLMPDTMFYQVICDCNESGIQGTHEPDEIKRTFCRLKPTHSRHLIEQPKDGSAARRPNFIRTWFQPKEESFYADFKRGDISETRGYMQIYTNFEKKYEEFKNLHKITNDIYAKINRITPEQFMELHGNDILRVLGETMHKTGIQAKYKKNKKRRRRRKKKTKRYNQ